MERADCFFVKVHRFKKSMLTKEMVGSSTQAPTSGFMLIVGIGYGDGLHNSMQEMSIQLANGVAKVLGRVIWI